MSKTILMTLAAVCALPPAYAADGPTWPPIVALLTVSSKPGWFLAGVEREGIMRSTDGGKTWSHPSSDLTGGTATVLVANPTKPDSILAVTVGEGGGVYRTDDAGASRTKLTFVALPRAWVPGDPSILLAGGNSMGVVGSTDGGESWVPLFQTRQGLRAGQIVPGFGCGLIVSTIKADPGYRDCILVGTIPSTVSCPSTMGPGLFRANLSSGEVSKLPFKGFLVWDFDLTPRNAGRILAASGDLWVSSDDGTTWKRTLTSEPGKPFLSVHRVSISPLEPTLALAGTFGDSTWRRALYRSTDAGETWSLIETEFSGVDRILFHPTDPAIVFVVSNAGVFVSVDAGRTWTPATKQPK